MNRWRRRSLGVGGAAFFALALLTGCSVRQADIPHRSFDGLPISGTLTDARAAGFTQCVELSTGLRCRKSGVRIAGQGPYEAALDLAQHDGSGGFTYLTLWHDRDQNALFAIGDALEHQGWSACLTGTDKAGDQKIYTRPGTPVRISMDISYYGKRSLRVIPTKEAPAHPCAEGRK